MIKKGMELKCRLFEGKEFITKSLQSAAGSEVTLDKVLFGMTVFNYNPQSGLFIAGGTDDLGDYGIVGDIMEEKINFKRIYAGLPPSTEISRDEITVFNGDISKQENVISASGTYRNSDSGFWQMNGLL